jgi:hypothetical protein
MHLLTNISCNLPFCSQLPIVRQTDRVVWLCQALSVSRSQAFRLSKTKSLSAGISTDFLLIRGKRQRWPTPAFCMGARIFSVADRELIVFEQTHLESQAGAVVWDSALVLASYLDKLSRTSCLELQVSVLVLAQGYL